MKPLKSWGDLGHNLNLYGKEKVAALQSMLTLPGDVYTGKRKATPMDALNFAGLAMTGGGGGGVANLGVGQKTFLKKVAKGAKEYTRSAKQYESEINKPYLKSIMQQAQRQPEFSTKDINKVHFADRVDQPFNVARHMGNRDLEFNMSYNDSDLIYSKGLMDNVPYGPAPKAAAMKEMKGALPHEVMHDVAQTGPITLKTKHNEMDYNRAMFSLKRASDRFHTYMDHPKLAKKMDYDVKYANAMQETQAVAMESRSVMLEEIFKQAAKHKKNPDEVKRLMRRADAMYKSDVAEGTKWAMKEFKKTNPKEYGIVNRMAKGDMAMKYGKNWKKDKKFYEHQWNQDYQARKRKHEAAKKKEVKAKKKADNRQYGYDRQVKYYTPEGKPIS